MDEDIQVQVDFRGIKRVFVAPQPRTYSNLLALLQTHVNKIDTASCCLLYENDEGDYVVLPKDNSRRIPGIDLLRLKIQVLES
jgi:hypothetical protein